MKKRFQISFTLAFVFFMHISLYGQETASAKDNTQFKHSLGVGAGLTTGYGLSYRYVPNKFGIQLTTALLKNDYNTDFNLGVTFLYKLIEAEKTNFFLYQGNMYYFNRYQYEDYYPEETSSYLNNSLGIGIEFIILKRVSFNLMGGYAFLDNFEQIGFTGETGLYFKF